MMYTSDGGARLGRRHFIRRVIAAGTGALAGLSLFGAAKPRIVPARAAEPPLPGNPPDKETPNGITVQPTDRALSAGPVEYRGVVTPISGYLSAPAGGEIYPGVLVIHDFFGLSAHIKDVTRRLAKAGYTALAPDLLSRIGGTDKQGDANKIISALGGIGVAAFLQDLNTSVGYLGAQPLVAKSRTGVLGFGLGGTLAWNLLARNPDPRAGVMLYGGIPPFGAVPFIKGAVLAIFAEADRQDAADMTELDQAMKKTGVPWAFKTEPKVSRGFFDDSRDRYAADAAKDAWKMTLDWFGKHLGA